MSPLILILLILVVAVAFYGLSRLSSSTAREVAIPFADGELPRAEVKAALERMGCLASDDGGSAITGLLPGSGGSWGQEVTVKIETGRIRVRSAFSSSQAFGARKNQENVDRFRAEWERRAEVRAAAADPVVQASSEARAREVARNTMWGGGLAVAAGMGLLSIALCVPAREGASPGSKISLVGLALMPLAYGLPRVWAAVARLRKKADG
jgi:hypothetical protein